MTKEILFYGIASTYTFECKEMAESAEVLVSAYVNNLSASDIPKGLNHVYEKSYLKSADKSMGVCVPLITPMFRKKLVQELLDEGFTNFYNLIDRSANISTSAKWMRGFNVNKGVVVASNCSFGEFTSINRSVSIGHDAVVGNYVSFGPGCVLGGHVEVGDYAFIGLNATILPKVKIGRNSVVGAGSVVTKDVPDNSLVFGNPARVIKSNIKGYNQ